MWTPANPASSPSDRESGAALVEFALVLTLLVMLVFGIVEFGRAYNAQVTLTHATREGARTLAVTGDSAAAASATLGAATSLDPSLVTVSAGSCSPGATGTVTASYPLSYDIPFVGAATISLSSTSVMRCGG
jgi:Flp pilus assembly protein TadG